MELKRGGEPGSGSLMLLTYKEWARIGRRKKKTTAAFYSIFRRQGSRRQVHVHHMKREGSTKEPRFRDSHTSGCRTLA